VIKKNGPDADIEANGGIAMQDFLAMRPAPTAGAT
jgi:hypothetical protein